MAKLFTDYLSDSTMLSPVLKMVSNPCLTLHNIVSRCLSSAGLPRPPGYSKSRSRPSKLWSRRNLSVVWTNLVLVCFNDNMAVISAVPAFQPPTASDTFSSGLIAFKSITLSYLSDTERCMLFCDVERVVLFFVHFHAHNEGSNS